MAKRRIGCDTLKITNPKLAALLGKTEFTSLSALMKAVPIGKEVVTEFSGDQPILIRLSGLRFTSSGQLIMQGTSASGGRYHVDIDRLLEVVPKGKARAKVLDKYPGLNTPDVAPAASSREEALSPRNKFINRMDNPDPSVKWIKYETTTGQDVESDEQNLLKADPRIELKHQVSQNPGAYQFFIVSTNGGQELAAVQSAQYRAARFKKGSPLTSDEILALAPQSDAGPVTLPMEGSINGGGTFFGRQHDERISIYMRETGATRKEAELFYSQGASRLEAARRRALTSPVEVGVTSVSPGMWTGNRIPLGEMQSATAFVNKEGPLAGRIFIRTQVGDSEVDIPAVMMQITDAYPEEVLDSIAEKFFSAESTGTVVVNGEVREVFSPELTADELAFFETLFGTSHRGRLWVDKRTGSLRVGMARVKDLTTFKSQLANLWPIATNKMRAPDSVTTDYQNGKFVQMRTADWLHNNLFTEGTPWKMEVDGKVVEVPYSANRYFVLDVPTFTAEAAPQAAADVTADATTETVTVNPKQRLADAYNSLAANKASFDTLLTDSSDHARAIKLAFPQAFGRFFTNSFLYNAVVNRKMKVVIGANGRLTIDRLVDNMMAYERSYSADLADAIEGVVYADMLQIREALDAGLEPAPSVHPAVIRFLGSGTDLQEAARNASRFIVTDMVASFKGRLQSDKHEQAIAFVENMVSDLLEYGSPVVENRPDGTGAVSTADVWQWPTIVGIDLSKSTGMEHVPTVTLVTAYRSDRRAISPELLRGIYIAANRWTAEMEDAYRKLIAGESTAIPWPAEVDLVYSGPGKIKMSLSPPANPASMTAVGFDGKFEVLNPSVQADSELLSQMALQSASISLPEDVGNLSVQFIGTKGIGPASNMNVSTGLEVTDTFMQRLADIQDSELTPEAFTEQRHIDIVNMLGQSFGIRLLMTNPNVSVEQAREYAKYIGDERFKFTRPASHKSFSITESSARLIADGRKRFSIRGIQIAANRPGLVKIGDEFYDIRELPATTLEGLVAHTGLTPALVEQAFTGDGSELFSDLATSFFRAGGEARIFRFVRLTSNDPVPTAVPVPTDGPADTAKVAEAIEAIEAETAVEVEQIPEAAQAPDIPETTAFYETAPVNTPNATKAPVQRVSKDFKERLKKVVSAIFTFDDLTPVRTIAGEFGLTLAPEERAEVLQWAGHTEWTEETDDIFANGYIKYLFGHGKSIIGRIFDKFSAWVLKMLGGADAFEKSSPQINPAMSIIYNKLTDRFSEATKEKAAAIRDKVESSQTPTEVLTELPMEATVVFSDVEIQEAIDVWLTEEAPAQSQQEVVFAPVSGKTQQAIPFTLRSKGNRLINVPTASVFALMSPEDDMRNPANRSGESFTNAERYLSNYADDQRWIDRKTGERTAQTVELEAPIAFLDKGILRFQNGRHRLAAGAALGYEEVTLEVAAKDAEAIIAALAAGKTSDEVVQVAEGVYEYGGERVFMVPTANEAMPGMIVVGRATYEAYQRLSAEEAQAPATQAQIYEIRKRRLLGTFSPAQRELEAQSNFRLESGDSGVADGKPFRIISTRRVNKEQLVTVEFDGETDVIKRDDPEYQVFVEAKTKSPLQPIGDITSTPELYIRKKAAERITSREATPATTVASQPTKPTGPLNLNC